ncbi:MAG: hypothetical protein IJK38_11615 [Oscillospiraceae bacterium]|nr:hypothetical protein [Oscillospiraceae bacterium]
MCKALEDMRSEVAREAAERVSVEAAMRLIANGKLTFEEIASVTDLSEGKVRELSKTKTD